MRNEMDATSAAPPPPPQAFGPARSGRRNGERRVASGGDEQEEAKEADEMLLVSGQEQGQAKWSQINQPAPALISARCAGGPAARRRGGAAARASSRHFAPAGPGRTTGRNGITPGEADFRLPSAPARRSARRLFVRHQIGPAKMPDPGGAFVCSLAHASAGPECRRQTGRAKFECVRVI